MGWVEETFKAGQNPFGWLSSAERLQAAAETILEREEAGAPAYFSALGAARREAVEKSYSSKDKTGVAEVRCEPPNYLPAQLLYAFAFENIFKGMMVANDPALANETKLNSELKSHEFRFTSRQSWLRSVTGGAVITKNTERDRNLGREIPSGIEIGRSHVAPNERSARPSKFWKTAPDAAVGFPESQGNTCFQNTP